jgi:hypothetical protein
MFINTLKNNLRFKNRIQFFKFNQFFDIINWDTPLINM